MCTTTTKYHKIENIKSLEAILKETTVKNLKEREWEKSDRKYYRCVHESNNGIDLHSAS